jgi:hypothetical protein
MKHFPLFALVLFVSSLAFGQVRIVTQSPLPDGTVAVPYSATIQTKAGSAPFTWSSEGLPTGLTLTPSSDTRSATLSGTPTSSATLNFTITVTGFYGHVSSVNYNLTVDQSGGHLANLTWQEGSSGILGYNVYRGTTSGGPYSQVNSSLLPSKSYSDSSVQSGDTYYYVATEVNNAGEESGYSNETQAVIP